MFRGACGPSSRNLQGRRLLSTAVLLAILFLPFHIHFYSSQPPANQNCACFSGAQAQMGPVHAFTWEPPLLGVFPIQLEDYEVFDLLTPRSHPTRAPPAF